MCGIRKEIGKPLNEPRGEVVVEQQPHGAAQPRSLARCEHQAPFPICRERQAGADIVGLKLRKIATVGREPVGSNRPGTGRRNTSRPT